MQVLDQDIELNGFPIYIIQARLNERYDMLIHRDKLPAKRFSCLIAPFPHWIVRHG